MVLRAVEFHALYALNGLQAAGQPLRLGIGDVVHQHAAAAEGDKFRLHGGQPPPGLCLPGQIAGEVVVDRNPFRGEHAKNGEPYVQQVECLPLVDNKGRRPLDGALLLPALPLFGMQS